MSFSPAGPKASVWINKRREAALVFVANIPNQEYTGTMTVDVAALPPGAQLTAYDAMLDQELGSITGPVRLTVKPMRYRMITVGLRIPLPEGARIRNDDE